MAKDLAIVLNNGSINSAVITALASQRYRPIMLYAETVSDGNSRTRSAYDLQVAHFKPYREHALPMPFLANANLDVSADPRSTSMLQRQLMSLLPLVASAARFAAHYQSAAVYLGLRVGSQGDDLAQATEYVQVWNEMLQIPCGHGDLEILTPLLELDAWQVVDVGFQVGAPLDRTWSCSEQSAEPCWTCRGCREREVAFQQAAKPDPLHVAKRA
jgi:hypothetical protein